MPYTEVGAVRSIDLQEDGKLAIVHGDATDAPNSVVSWASPAEPTPHALPLPPQPLGSEYTVRIADDRIAYQGDTSTEEQRNNGHEDFQVGIADLAGKVRVHARRTRGRRFDYDGDRLVWSELRCSGWRLVVRGVEEPGMAEPPPATCPLRPLAPPVVRRGRVRFDIACAPSTAPCRLGEIVLRARGQKIGSRYRIRRPVRVRLSRRGKQMLRRTGTLRVKTTLNVYGPNNFDFDWRHDDFHARQGTITLRLTRGD